MLDDVNDVEDEDPDVYCDMANYKRMRTWSINYICYNCPIKTEGRKKSRDGSCCTDKRNYATPNLEMWHKHLDMHRSRGEVVPQEYYEMRIIP